MKTYNILSPDKISIRLIDFTTEESAMCYYTRWKTKFINQGYYSSNRGKIDLRDLDDLCEFIIIHSSANL